MSAADPRISFIITMPASRMEEVRQAAVNAGAELRFPQDLICIDFETEGNPPFSLGDDIPFLLERMNQYLEQQGLVPIIPGDPGQWAPAQAGEFLNLATCWMRHDPDRSNRLEDNHWESQGRSWESVTREFPHLFPQEGE